MGLVARDKVREAGAAFAEARANLYGTRCQHAVALATWRYRTSRPVAGT